MIQVPKSQDIWIREDDPGIAVGVFGERLGELEFGLERNLSKVGVLFKRGTGDEIKLVNSNSGDGIEDFRKIPPDNDLPIKEKAEKRRNLGFSKLPFRPASGRIKKNSGEKER